MSYALWIEVGASVHGKLTDVGNICAANTCHRLLQVATATLLKMGTWSLSHGFANFLGFLQGNGGGVGGQV